MIIAVCLMFWHSLPLPDFHRQTVLLPSYFTAILILNAAEAFVKLRKATVSLVVSVWLSTFVLLLSHGTVRLPIHGLSFECV